jgi:hypothetical protein
MPIRPANLHAAPGEQDSPSKGSRAMLPRPTMKMYSLQPDPHLSNLAHPRMDLGLRIQIVPKLAREGRGQLIRGLLLNGDAPEDLHFGGELLDFEELVGGVGCGEADAVVRGPFQVVLVFYRV